MLYCDDKVCAQRLSASSEFARTLSGLLQPHCRVLNAFRHHRNSHDDHPIEIAVDVAVLNAFRHHRNSHNAATKMSVDILKVLNAFRHHRNSHKSRLPRRAAGRWCSTPFGIIGIRTCRLSGSPTCGSVLNAFRHHRNSHQSAPLATRPYVCAQRLSASSEFAHELRRRVGRVLNVLNAFRHHRNSHIVKREHQVRALLCSTPFGIIGIRTRRVRYAPRTESPVLNAFRHHRNSHFVSR